jgi:hypothetical protein
VQGYEGIGVTCSTPSGWSTPSALCRRFWGGDDTTSWSSPLLCPRDGSRSSARIDTTHISRTAHTTSVRSRSLAIVPGAEGGGQTPPVCVRVAQSRRT